MKRIYFLFCMLCFIAVSISSQNLQDVVYLKNGSVIRGVIIEQIPNQSLKVKTNDGSIFVYKMTEVEKMTKEQATNTYSGNNVNSYSGGLTNCYKHIKINYDPDMYISQPGEPYKPIVSGVCSLLIPGLGQMICGETNRGFGFLGGSLGCILFVGLGGTLNSSIGIYVDDIGKIMTIIGIAGFYGIEIMSIVDAVKVAKVKNMYVNDMRSKTSLLQLEVAPYIDQLSINNEIVRPLGMTMRVKF